MRKIETHTDAQTYVANFLAPWIATAAETLPEGGELELTELIIDEVVERQDEITLDLQGDEQAPEIDWPGIIAEYAQDIILPTDAETYENHRDACNTCYPDELCSVGAYLYSKLHGHSAEFECNEDCLHSPSPACECGEIHGVRCAWAGPSSEAVTVEYVPEYMRAQSAAAGGAGEYPFGYSRRIRCAPECSTLLVESEPAWFWIIQ